MNAPRRLGANLELRDRSYDTSSVFRIMQRSLVSNHCVGKRGRERERGKIGAEITPFAYFVLYHREK